MLCDLPHLTIVNKILVPLCDSVVTLLQTYEQILSLMVWWDWLLQKSDKPICDLK